MLMRIMLHRSVENLKKCITLGFFYVKNALKDVGLFN